MTTRAGRSFYGWDLPVWVHQCHVLKISMSIPIHAFPPWIESRFNTRPTLSLTISTRYGVRYRSNLTSQSCAHRNVPSFYTRRPLFKYFRNNSKKAEYIYISGFKSSNASRTCVFHGMGTTFRNIQVHKQYVITIHVDHQLTIHNMTKKKKYYLIIEFCLYLSSTSVFLF